MQRMGVPLDSFVRVRSPERGPTRKVVSPLPIRLASCLLRDHVTVLGAVAACRRRPALPPTTCAGQLVAPPRPPMMLFRYDAGTETEICKKLTSAERNCRRKLQPSANRMQYTVHLVSRLDVELSSIPFVLVLPAQFACPLSPPPPPSPSLLPVPIPLLSLLPGPRHPPISFVHALKAHSGCVRLHDPSAERFRALFHRNSSARACYRNIKGLKE
ncbi:hypothetical protein B0H12DRAFT_215323 [Mycena haematopus]|nr:hypothetical protein B0H12DRAFT_215323 [Mycena haematopus]